MFLFGPPNIEKLQNARDIPGLIKALSYKKDTNVQKAAIEGLASMGMDAVMPLTQAIESAKDDTMRQNAKEALEKLGSQIPTETLINALKNERTRKFAVAALGGKGAPVIDSLISFQETVQTNRET